MYYHDQMNAGSQFYFRDIFGINLQMGLFYDGRVAYDVTENLPYTNANYDKGFYIAQQGNREFCEFLLVVINKFAKLDNIYLVNILKSFGYPLNDL